MGSNYVALSKEDTYDLIELAKSGDERAREQLIYQNTGLVKNIALKFIGTGYELDDLLQIGYIGLLKAVDRFNSSYGVMFSTYAVPMILGEIRRYLRDDGRIKVGRQVKQDIKNLKNIQESFYNNNGRYPKMSELAELMETDVESVLSIMEASDALNNFESLDDPDRQERQNKELYTETEERNIDMIHLKSIIGKLSDKERQIIVLRYFKDMTQQQIAGLMGISQVQVSRIEKKVLATLRQEME
ncbi:sigma-70 family RNA polymerase sigma factor [Sinanaerobacter chloroacetimidivorans]|jgi:RNA polymerase sporulation-specific sigma factor|uniref:RNA polymerase sigma factor n=1 Tax=Sinanaerobacter chloroacetimidivorans TaxID=2818044 RepID=A0A8J7W5M7_9FIRM|nr:sigma-70 family RNA polymerase sigma factor [Sinanaerobacter chloroacetimidivorans]MBR0599506.1 sigma-70 family RNA polymerase sigma factor [Sinanaerobacter chloroacetimidivorans]